MELGAAILFDKPIILTVPAGVKVPVSLKTIATKIVELEEPLQSETNSRRVQAAIDDVVKTLPFRQPAGKAHHGDTENGK